MVGLAGLGKASKPTDVDARLVHAVSRQMRCLHQACDTGQG